MYDIVLSFTSWKGRIYDESLITVLNSMLNQTTTRNYKVVLVLSTDEFTNKEKDLPANLLKIAETNDIFEILWTKENTKAYKKYFPTRRKYPNENICILDDDSELHSDFVNVMCTMLDKNPGKMLIGTNHFYQNQNTNIVHIRYGAACYRPDSLYDLDEHFGMKYFKDHDDELYLLASVLNGTHSVCFDCHALIDVDKYQQDKRLMNVGNLEYAHIGRMWLDCLVDNPELAIIYNKNKNIEN